MTTILKSTTKGQITLPSSWRKQFNTDRFIATCDNNTIKIQPLEIEDFIKKDVQKERVVFNSARDNKGKGVAAKVLIKILKKLAAKERMSLLETIKSIFSETAERLDVKKIKSTNFYRLRTGRFRIIFHRNGEKIIIDDIRIRNENTYKNF